ncbi:type IV pilin protein [Candidatus Avelusimicrobium fimicolum]|uniref:type IV pilin protein n=1 Tax=Candidatus Avelusimicrobium fimicolum TaxID=3416216 RepID=UPI003D137905
MNKKGFTLIELLAVVLIVAILSGVALPQYRKVVEKARLSEAESMMRTIYDSSERLAGEFGYRNFVEMYQNNASKAVFSRMDIFDSSNLPSGCSLTDSNTLTCAKFVFVPYVLKNGRAFVQAKKRDNPYKDTVILFDRANQQLYCSPEGDACDTYGLDVL